MLPVEGWILYCGSPLKGCDTTKSVKTRKMNRFTADEVFAFFVGFRGPSMKNVNFFFSHFSFSVATKNIKILLQAREMLNFERHQRKRVLSQLG